jgi:predicted DNA-binding antitoxin AbrB/MazE fold protein
VCVCAESKEDIKKTKIVLKEGCQYRVKILFFVQREIVAGLRYEQKVYRKGVRGKLVFWWYCLIEKKEDHLLYKINSDFIYC